MVVTLYVNKDTVQQQKIASLELCANKTFVRTLIQKKTKQIIENLILKDNGAKTIESVSTSSLMSILSPVPSIDLVHYLNFLK